MENEIWKDIDGFEGRYQVSNLGNIKSLNYRNQKFAKLLTPNISNKGYGIVQLNNKKKSTFFLVHRLVAIAFVANPYNYPIVNHKDENPLNNRADNLEWCTYSYNRTYSMDIHSERRKELADNLTKHSTRNKKGIPHKHNKRVAILDNNNNITSIYDNASVAAKNLGLRVCNVTEVCKTNKHLAVGTKQQMVKKRKTGGHIFVFLEE